MAKKFDATGKGLVDRGPPDWAALLGFPGLPVEVADADVSTVTAASDKVLRVGGPSPCMLTIDFQAGPDASVPRRVHLYNTIIADRHDLPVHSVVVLLHPRANLSAVNGTYIRQIPGKEPYLIFRYQVLRVWELPVAELLKGGLATLPLAPISDVREEDLPGVVGQMKVRLDACGGALAEVLWAATYVLMGLRYKPALVAQLIREVTRMEESATFQAIIEEGALREAKRTLLRQGSQLIGPPPSEVAAVIDGISSLERLDELLMRVLKASSWEDLLGRSDQ
jgi:hypothetical protein